MKWFKRIVIAVPVIIVVILVTVFLINQITPKPISLLVRKQFDTSEKEQVYARPDDFQQKIKQIDRNKEITYPSKYKKQSYGYLTHRKRRRKSAHPFLDAWSAYVGGDKTIVVIIWNTYVQTRSRSSLNIDYERSPEAKHPTPVNPIERSHSSSQKEIKSKRIGRIFRLVAIQQAHKLAESIC